jgi:transposase-like protein
VIILCVRWYLRYKLSFRDLAQRELTLVNAAEKFDSTDGVWKPIQSS